MPWRLGIFTSHPIQYQVPLFRALGQHREIDLKVLFGSRHGLDVALDVGFGTRFRWDIPLVSGYNHAFLGNRSKRPDVTSFFGMRVGDVKSSLGRERFDALLVFGWNTLAHVQVLLAAHRAGLPLLIRGESNLTTAPDSLVYANVRNLVRRPVRRWLYRPAAGAVAAFLPIGSLNREFYHALGVPESKMFWAGYAVENERFSLPPSRRSAARRELRERLSINENTVVFSSVGKLIGRKCPFDLLHAFAYMATSADVHLIFVGDGEEKVALEAEARSLALTDRVTITGFINQSSLPDWYAMSDCLVLPSGSSETWGLVVNEAMASGLPVLVSKAVGCSRDLVREGENGHTFPFGDTTALADRMATIARLTAKERKALGTRSAEIVSSFSIDATVDAIISALRTLVPTRP